MTEHEFVVTEDGGTPDEILRIPEDDPEDVRWVAVCAGHVASIQNHPLAPGPEEYSNIHPVSLARSIRHLAQGGGHPDPPPDHDILDAVVDSIGGGTYGWGAYCGGSVNQLRIAESFVRKYRHLREKKEEVTEDE